MVLAKKYFTMLNNVRVYRSYKSKKFYSIYIDLPEGRTVRARNLSANAVRKHILSLSISKKFNKEESN